MHTGSSGLPVKNFLICLEMTICAGVTGGNRTHGLPAVEELDPIKYRVLCSAREFGSDEHLIFNIIISKFDIFNIKMSRNLSKTNSKTFNYFFI